MPSIASKYKRLDKVAIKMKKQNGRDTVDNSKRNMENETHDLDYTNRNFEYLSRKLSNGVPNMSKTVPRKAQLPGQTISNIDPTGSTFIETASLGVNNQGYGLAAFRKGTLSVQGTVANQCSYFSTKEKRSYDQLPFQGRLGRS